MTNADFREAMMRRRSVGRGVELTELGLGAVQFGHFHRFMSDDDVRGAFDTAWDAGIRYFDVAPHYGLGLAEKRLGALLRQRPRDEYVVSTKVGRLLVPNPKGAGRQDDEVGFLVPADLRREWDFSRDGVRRCLDESLTRMGLDRFDIVYLHDPDDFGDQAVREAMPALAEFRDEGVVAAIGAGMNRADMLARFIREADPDVLMLAGRLTLLDGSALDDLLPLAHERGIAIVAAGVFNSGLLSDPHPRPGAMYDYLPAPHDLAARAEAIARVCETHRVTLPEAALRYPMSHPAVASIVVGARSAAQVEENIARSRTVIPPDLWLDLQDRGLLRRGYPD